jgi:HK97 family phage portal protein
VGKRKRERSARRSEVQVSARHELAGGQLIHGTGPTFGPSNVTETIALAVDTVYACCRLIADGVSSAVWSERRGNLTLPPSRIVRRPAAGMTRREWLWSVVASMALYSFCPLQVVGGVDSDGVPMSLVPRSPAKLARDPGTGALRYDGRSVDESEWRVVRRTLWPTLGAAESSVIRLARDLIAEAGSMDAYSLDFWQNGGAPLTVLSTDQELFGTQATDARTAYQTAREAGPSYPLVLGKGMKVDGFGVDIAEAQGTTADQRAQLVASLARYWGVPPTFVNAPVLSGTMVYQTVADAGTYLVAYTLEPYAQAVADLLSEELPADYITGRYVTLGLDHLSKPSPGARASYYEVMERIGAMSVDEIRDAEGMPPIEGSVPAPEPAPVQEVAA